jgi:beta-glucosidase-like glycosyl hydrolase
MKLFLFAAAAAVVSASSTDKLSCSDGTSCNVTSDQIFGYGNDIVHFNVNTTADCCAGCNKEPRCRAWNVDHNAVTKDGLLPCWLHSSTVVHERKGATSGLRSTPLPPPTKDGWYPCANKDASKFKFCDTSLSIDDRLADLVPRISTKLAGGQLTARESPAVEEFSLPAYYWGTNAIHGIQNTDCIDGHCPTSFPAPCGLAATFNMSVVKDMGAVIGQELRAYWNEQHHNSLDTWSPTININRDPRWGRNVESPGEDPLLNGLYGSAYLEGLQGDDEKTVQAVVTLKHWFAYNLENYHGTTRHNFDAQVSAYDLQNTYWPAWRKAIQENGALGIMCSYNSVNGVPTCTNNYTTKMLRNDWNFEGYITSDSDSCHDVYSQHHYTKTAEEAVAACLHGGTDIDSGSTYSGHLENSVEQGDSTREMVDQALTNSYRMRFRMGLFDPNVSTIYDNITKEVVGCAANVAKSDFAARQSLVLLRNEATSVEESATRTLPFVPGKNVAVIGRSSNSSSDILGNYIGPICPTGKYQCVTTLYEAIKSSNGDGKTCLVDDPTAITNALHCAQGADYVVLTVSNAGSEGGGEGGDRDAIRLDDEQMKLAKAMLTVGKPLVLVSINGGLISLDELANQVPAILVAWMPGAHGAKAVSDAIFGAYNPGGKMPATMYNSSYIEEVDFLDMSMQAGPGRSYRFFTGKPLYEFGYGLSYTTFALSWAGGKAPETQTLLTSTATASFEVKIDNKGEVDGDEVVQVYFKQPSNATNDDAPVPLRQLVDFKRETLMKGCNSSLHFNISAMQLAVVNAEGSLQVASGMYTIIFTRGNDAEDDLTAHVNIAVGDKPITLGSVPKWW